ncbi:MAG: glutaredoxin family protein, partial [Acidobacteria bacterium]|nr:glutaredoxin family protein [Acidobacteriota bacterium]
REDFAKKKIAFEYLNVQRNPSALEEMLSLTGGARQVPVILESGKVTVGYGGT